MQLIAMLLSVMPVVHSMTLASPAARAGSVSVEEGVSLFGRLADSQHVRLLYTCARCYGHAQHVFARASQVFSEPIRTAASGFEFSSNTAIKPKWLIAYVSREPCGEDVDQPTHCTRWSSLLFPGGAQVCTRESFDAALSSAEYTAPLGTPKWSVPGQALIDIKVCAAPPSPAALDALWSALGGAGDELACDTVLTRLREMSTKDDLNEAVLYSEFAEGLQVRGHELLDLRGLTSEAFTSGTPRSTSRTH